MSRGARSRRRAGRSSSARGQLGEHGLAGRGAGGRQHPSRGRGQPDGGGAAVAAGQVDDVERVAEGGQLGGLAPAPCRARSQALVEERDLIDARPGRPRRAGRAAARGRTRRRPSATTPPRPAPRRCWPPTTSGGRGRGRWRSPRAARRTALGQDLRQILRTAARPVTGSGQKIEDGGGPGHRGDQRSARWSGSDRSGPDGIGSVTYATPRHRDRSARRRTSGAGRSSSRAADGSDVAAVAHDGAGARSARAGGRRTPWCGRRASR